MPYYRWYGSDSDGIVHSGQSGARSIDDLCNELQVTQINLILAEPLRQWPLLSRVSLEKKVAFFNQLAILLNSGIFLDKALLLLHDQTSNQILKEAVYDVSLGIQDGKKLSESLNFYPHLFHPLMISMIQAGEESGKLALGLHNLADYLQERHTFERQIQGALLLPVLTFLFFVIIALTIFVFIIPAFASMLTASGNTLPHITQIMITASSFLTSKKIFFVVTACAVVLYGIKKLMRSTVYAPFFDRLGLRVPFIGTLLKNANLCSFLQSLALLVQSSVHVVPGLKMAQETVGNSVLKKQIVAMIDNIEAGRTCKDAMIHSGIFSSEAISMIAVGEESGNLGLMLQKATDLYKQRVNKSISLITSLLQPLLMIILGMLILGLVFAIYLPIFNLSNVIS